MGAFENERLRDRGTERMEDEETERLRKVDSGGVGSN
jgi:hypothetical protein